MWGERGGGGNVESARDKKEIERGCWMVESKVGEKVR